MRNAQIMNNYFIIKINKENNENFDPNLQVPKECMKKIGSCDDGTGSHPQQLVSFFITYKHVGYILKSINTPTSKIHTSINTCSRTQKYTYTHSIAYSMVLITASTHQAFPIIQ